MNVFDAIKKPPSVAMEKIQSSTAATLDRMAVLQQRYRHYKETMNSDNSSDKSRRTSTTSTIDSVVSPQLYVLLVHHPLFNSVSMFLDKPIPLMNRPPLPPQNVNNHHWENTVRRTDSLSSVSNPLQCYPNNMNHQKVFIDQAQACGVAPIRRPIPLPTGNVQAQHPPRNISASVLNLNQGAYPQPGFQQQNHWGINQMSQVKIIFQKTCTGQCK